MTFVNSNELSLLSPPPALGESLELLLLELFVVSSPPLFLSDPPTGLNSVTGREEEAIGFVPVLKI